MGCLILSISLGLLVKLWIEVSWVETSDLSPKQGNVITLAFVKWYKFMGFKCLTPEFLYGLMLLVDRVSKETLNHYGLPCVCDTCSVQVSLCLGQSKVVSSN